MPYISDVHTQYTNLSNTELLAKIDSVRHLSPIIQELCKRLEEGDLYSKDTNDRVECPICQGKLRVDYCGGNDMFKLHIRDE